MKLALFGATGALGREIALQALDAGHHVVALVRTPSKLPSELRDQLDVIQGDALDPEAVERTLAGGVDAVLFAIGVDKNSPEDLCTDVTRHIFAVLRKQGRGRFIWCGGGSNTVPEDHVSLGSRFVSFFARNFLGLRHRDKAHQLELLNASTDVAWYGVRPLQMNAGERRGEYRLGFHPYSGMSKIHFADCADAMLGMLEGEEWLHRAPIVQY